MAMAADASTPGAPATGGSARASSYRDILRTSALIGAASLVGALIGLVRTKLLAMLLGPAGIGLIGVLQSLIDLARSVAGLGFQESGVRQIAESAVTRDTHKVALTVAIVRRVAIVLGILGAAAMVVLARPLSHLTFGHEGHATAVAWLSIALFFRFVADGQAAMFQGLRAVGTLARISVFGALTGAAVSVAAAAAWGQDGVVSALIGTTVSAATVSLWYATRDREVPRLTQPPGASEIRQEAGALLKLGSAFLISALLTTGAAWAVRAFVLRSGGTVEAGLYQAAWAIAGLYVGFVLQAMGTDFYPRLVGVIRDTSAANRIVNEQARVSLLLAGPGVLATLVFAEFALALFYSADFADAAWTLRWMTLGIALRVVSWPMGYIIVARNHRVAFVGAELAWAVVNVGLSFALISKYGTVGAGVGFFASYVFHAVMVYAIVHRMQGFSWGAASLRTGAAYLASTAAVFVAYVVAPLPWAVAASAVLLVLHSVYAIRTLNRLVPELLPGLMRRLRPRPADHDASETRTP